jgi:hypothetical protein
MLFIYNVFSSIDSVSTGHFKTDPTETIAFCFGIVPKTYKKPIDTVVLFNFK